MDHNNVYKGFAIAGQDLIIFGVDSIVSQPSKGSSAALAWFLADVQHRFKLATQVPDSAGARILKYPAWAARIILMQYF